MIQNVLNLYVINVKNLISLDNLLYNIIYYLYIIYFNNFLFLNYEDKKINMKLILILSQKIPHQLFYTIIIH